MSNITAGRVAVISSAQTQLRPSWSGLQHVDLISDAVTRALLGSGLTMADVGVVIDCGSDVLDGRSISNCGFLGAMGAHHKEESRVEEDGLFGAVYAVNKVASGAAGVGLIVAYSKPSESVVENYYSTIAEPFYQRPVGLNKAIAAGLMADQYLTGHDVDERDLAVIAARSWSRASRNGSVADADDFSVDDILASDHIADPLRALAISRPVDGAVAVLVAAEDVARRLSDAPVWVTGMGSAMDSQFLSERSPGRLEAAEAAAATAMRRSGRTSASSFDIAEVSAVSAADEAMVVEALGLAERGRAADAYAEGAAIDINPSGGAIPADPIMATGLVRLHEAAARLDGRIGDGGANSAIVHGSGGLGMQTHCVFTLEV